jgi:hypothetical protein
MNEPGLNFFTRIYYSMAGFDNYRYFLRQGAGKAVVYLLLLAMLIGIITYIPVFNEINKGMDEVILNFDSSVPDFTFSNGELHVTGSMPVKLGENDYPIIIDTSDNPDESILEDYDSVMMFTKNKIIQKTYVNRQDTDLTMLKGLNITKAQVKDALPMLKPIGILFLIFGIIFFICGKFISALLISIIGMIINSVRKTNLSYQSIFKISVFSLTLPLLVCTVIDLLLHAPYMWLLFNVIAAVYVYGAINSIKKEIDTYHNENTHIE